MAGVAEEMEVEGQGLNQTFKDLFSGACGGIAQVLIGMYGLNCSRSGNLGPGAAGMVLTFINQISNIQKQRCLLLLIY